MNFKTKIIDVTVENLSEHPGVICFLNPKNEYYKLKVKWLKEQFKYGLKIKLLYVEGEKSGKDLSNMFRANTAGGQSMPKVICSFTASGQTGRSTSTRDWVSS